MIELKANLSPLDILCKLIPAQLSLPIKEERIFKLSEGNKYDYYICKGLAKKTYEIIHNKAKDTFICNCNNVRINNCYHIKAVIQMNSIG